ncbi:MAG: BamA/TamA family outer membrane protein [Bacteroidota bacterium]
MHKLTSWVAFLLVLGLVYQASAQVVLPNKDSVSLPKRNRLLIFPITSRTPETSWAFGFAGAYIFHAHSRTDTVTRTSTIPFGGLYTLNKQIVFGLGANIFFPGEKYVIRMENSFSSFPDKFWGIGNQTAESNLEKYEFKQFYINPILLRKIYRKFFLGLSYEYQKVYDFSYEAGGRFDVDNVPGRSGSAVSGLGLVLSRDSRNNAYSPTKGSLLQFTYTVFNSRLGSQFNYQTYELDVRKFFKTSPKHVLGIQTIGTFTNGNVPFRSLAVIGSASIMRGYYSGRFRDKNLLATQVEYRVPIWWRLGVVGFAGIGQVSEKIEDMNLRNFKYSVGAGIRLALLQQERFNLRLDYGFGNNNAQAFYVVVSEAF